MSHVTVFKVSPEGEVQGFGEVRNANGWAFHIWRSFSQKYGVGSVNDFEPVWKLANQQNIPYLERILLASTFDFAIARRTLISMLIKSYESFNLEFPHETLDCMIKLLASVKDDESVTGICWQTSQVDYWNMPNPEYDPENDDWSIDEVIPYNINQSDKHWFIEDEVLEEQTPDH